MRSQKLGSLLVRACAALFSVLVIVQATTSAAVLFTDGFGDGDRDNNGLDAGATETDPTDVGIPWLLTDGTSAVNFRAVDDAAGGPGIGNALQLNNTGSNNRPTIGHFSPVTLNDGDSLVLRFDMRLVSTSAPADRGVRFGLYHDTNGDDGTVDHGSAGSVSVDDVGYNSRVDAGADSSNATAMDVTRDDTTGTAILQATATGLAISSLNSADQLADATYRHFVLSLTRTGTSMLISLQQGSNAAITGIDPTPVGFVFDEVALGVRSNASMDTRWDNIQVEYIPVPEPASSGLIAAGAAVCMFRRRHR